MSRPLRKHPRSDTPPHTQETPRRHPADTPENSPENIPADTPGDTPETPISLSVYCMTGRFHKYTQNPATILIPVTSIHTFLSYSRHSHPPLPPLEPSRFTPKSAPISPQTHLKSTQNPQKSHKFYKTFGSFKQTFYLCATKPRPRWRNGRRARFRCACREACRFESCSGHPVKSQVINSQSLAIFTFIPCQRGVNQPPRNAATLSR